MLEKPTKAKGTFTDEDNEDEEEPVLPPALPLIQPLSSREVSIESLDQILRERMLSSTDYDFHEKHLIGENCDDNDELEIIEVEEPLEPVPMIDKCLQVTEEEINLCMGKTENPLPEVDQQSTFSEENLSALSSFTDSVSVFNDLERILPRYLDLNGYYNDYEDIDNHTEQNNIGDDTFIKKINDSILHNAYCTRLGKTEFTDLESLKGTHLMKSMTLTDILINQQKQRTDEGSIYSEPIYLQERFCENCKANMYRSNRALNEYTPFFSITPNMGENPQFEIGGRFQRFVLYFYHFSYFIFYLLIELYFFIIIEKQVKRESP